jgi:ABC-type glycerol-3-phosphate transport system substrate-binding protein
MKKLMALLMAATFVVAACSSSTEDAVDQYCDDLGDLKSAVQDAGSLTASSSVDDVNDASEEITKAYDAVISSASGVTDAVTSDIEAAQQTYVDTVNGLSGDSSVSDAFSDLQAAQSTYASSVESTLSQVSCSS